MFDDRLKLRRLKKEVEKIDQLYAADFRAAKTEDDYSAVKGEYDVVAADQICNLEGFKTHLLRKKAGKFGLEIEPFEEYWDVYPITQRSYLCKTGTAKLNQDITDARFAYRERWIDIVAPTASVLTSLLALALTALALYLQITGKLSARQ